MKNKKWRLSATGDFDNKYFDTYAKARKQAEHMDYELKLKRFSPGSYADTKAGIYIESRSFVKRRKKQW